MIIQIFSCHLGRPNYKIIVTISLKSRWGSHHRKEVNF